MRYYDIGDNCYLIVCSERQPSINEDLLLKQAQGVEKVLKILIVFDSNVWDKYGKEKVCKCGGHMHANLRWSWLNNVALYLQVGYWFFGFLFVMILSGKFTLIYLKIEISSNVLVSGTEIPVSPIM